MKKEVKREWERERQVNFALLKKRALKRALENIDIFSEQESKMSGSGLKKKRADGTSEKVSIQGKLELLQLSLVQS